MPLPRRAVEILTAQRPANAKPDDLVWPSAVTGRHRTPVTLLRILRRLGLTADELTVHGFRSAFCDWRAELTHFPTDLQEAALSHAIPGVRAAYQRGDLFNKRRVLMEAWSAHCGDDCGTNVVQIGRAAA